MESLELANQIADIMVDKQAEDILILDLQGLVTFTDYFIICSTNSKRQLNALKDTIRESIKQEGTQTVTSGTEGTAESGWILMDYNSVIVHLFDSDVRVYYDLEGLWESARIVAHIQ